MSLRILIDMNLSPAWADVLQQQGWDARHWSAVGDVRASDRTLMDWALSNDHVILTHDLDFSTLLALTHRTGPSVIQIRARDVTPDAIAPLLLKALSQHADDLASGALVVVDEVGNRVRILPIGSPPAGPEGLVEDSAEDR